MHQAPPQPSQARPQLDDFFFSQAASLTRPNKRSYAPDPSNSAPSTSSPRKRKRTDPPFPTEIIFIDDDDDDDDVQEAVNNENSDNLDWEHYHAGFIWPPLPHMIPIITDSAASIVDEIDHAALRLQRLRVAADDAPPGCIVVRPPGASDSDTWSRNKSLKSNTRRCATRDWEVVESELDLISTPGLLAASGGTISQSGPAVAFASSAIGGDSGAWTADQRSANKAGALLYWHQTDATNILIPQQRIDDGASVWEDPECHFRDNQHVRYSIPNGEEQEAVVRVYYSVTDVKFNPVRRNVFVSSSYDKSVQSWTYDENRRRVHSAWYSYEHSEVPQLLDFKPNSQILAVGCADGSSYIHNPDFPDPQKLTLNSSLRVGVTSQSWGPESTGISNYIFCGGAAADEKKGHCIAIASIDDELRFSARHLVEFFDLRMKPRAFFRQPLPASLNANISSDVVHSAFSPDGIFYACAREDNTAQPPDRATSRHSFGVTGMTWVNHNGASSPPLLVTGGNDGKIIEWDMRRSESKLLAELETSVGSLSVGNCYEGEMPLIAYLAMDHKAALKALKANIVEACAKHELVHWRDKDYRACLSMGTDYFVKFGNSDAIWPEFQTQSYIFDYARSNPHPDAPRIPQVVHHFGDSRTKYLVMEFIPLTAAPLSPDRTAQALLWLSRVPPPLNHVIGPLGGGHICHQSFKDYKAPLLFSSVEALQRYMHKAYTLLSRQGQKRVSPVDISGDSLMLAQSDMRASNFGVDQNGKTVLMDFAEIG
ncbi:hypothetical protein FRB90_012714 [Tulasnella sp. 427]|nr:hypothetical protein FRB90_012714 [Tulasnella sp. 427]